MYLESCIALQERLLNLNVLNIVFLLLLLLILVLDGYIQIAILIDVHLDHIFLQTRSCNLLILFFSSSLRLPAQSGFLIVFNLSFLITIASAYEAQGFLETLNCHYLGFLSFPLPFRLRLSLYVGASYVPTRFVDLE